jgi:hypothetical protein
LKLTSIVREQPSIEAVPAHFRPRFDFCESIEKSSLLHPHLPHSNVPRVICPLGGTERPLQQSCPDRTAARMRRFALRIATLNFKRVKRALRGSSESRVAPRDRRSAFQHTSKTTHQKRLSETAGRNVALFANSVCGIRATRPPSSTARSDRTVRQTSG